MPQLDMNLQSITLVLMGLLIFGLAFNAWINHLEKDGIIEGRRSIMVVAGVFGTLVGSVFVIGFVPAVLVGLCFVASGIPMIWGEIVRYEKRKQLLDAEQTIEILEKLDRDAKS